MLKTDANGNAMLPKSFNVKYKYSRHKIPVPLAMSSNILKKVPYFQKDPKNKHLLTRYWAKIGLTKTQTNGSFEAARFRVLDRHRSATPTTAS